MCKPAHRWQKIINNRAEEWTSLYGFQSQTCTGIVDCSLSIVN